MTSGFSPTDTSTCTVADRNQATTVAGYTQSYNALGNRTQEMSGTTTSFNDTYDAENQLTGVATDTYGTPDAGRWRMEFVYDGRGRMRIRRDFVWSAGVWSLSSEQRYVYDGMRLLQQRSSANVPQVSYTRGLDLSGSLDGAGGIGGLLARSTHATTSPYAVNSSAYYHADGNGNITYLLRSDAAANASYRYDPFGRTLSSSGTLAAANVLRFSSKPILLSSFGTWGDYYYGYRFYDPESQRWLNRDPIQESGGVNIYGFTANNPVNDYDPFGEDPPSSPRCIKLASSIDQKKRILAGKYRELSNNRGRLPESAPGDDIYFSRSVNGHKNAIALLEAKLAADIALYAATCSDPEPPKASATCPRPSSDDCEKVAVVVGTGAAAYLTYRCIRMIPSLFPPAWPTIPLNAITP